MEDCLDEKDGQILKEVFAKHKIKLYDCDYWLFWDWDKIQLDGDFTFKEMKAFTEAMSLMEKRHSPNQVQNKLIVGGK